MNDPQRLMAPAAKKRFWRLFALVVITAVAVAFARSGIGRPFTLEHLKQLQGQLEHWREARPVVMGVSFLLLDIAVTALSLPFASLMSIAAGAVFGLLWGTILVSFASTIGATGAFLTSRLVLHDWVQRRFGERLAIVNAGIERDGSFYLFTLRLVPLFPFFIINLVMGLTPMRTWTFYWVSQLGMLAATLVFVNAGTHLATLQSVKGLLSPELIGSFALLGLFPLLARQATRWISARRAGSTWTTPHRFDRNLVVIGAGSAGLVSAYIAAAIKAKVSLIEKGHMGGDCLNTGCVPSKALIRTAKLLSHINRAPEFGIARATAEFQFADVMDRVHRVINSVAPHDSIERYTQLGVEVLQGTARLLTPWEVEVTAADGTRQTLTTRSVILATGARPTVPSIPGLQEMPFLTTDTVWGLRELPRRLLILGAGPIACEMAQTFARLGSSVTVVGRSSRLLIREDPDVSDFLEKRFRAEGIDVRLNHRIERFETIDSVKALMATHTDQEVRIEFDTLLLALGRTANLTGYGLEDIGVETGSTIKTNGFLQTNFPHIYAAGDVAGPYQFTHTAAHQAWYASVNALFSPFKKFKVDYSVIPWATFTDPEIARVGLNELDAREAGIDYEVTTYPIEDLDRAIADEEATGFVKVLTFPGKDRILGAAIVGEHAGDLLAEFVLAMKHDIGLKKLLGTIHIYPTMAEANKYAAGVWRRAHAPQRLLGWVGRFHDWRRG
jgi:pyruvate/2-oxoglutarate dehydrogenase complex dihydrolipoamide dehydrogenase (E3) component/uncharacterized membrane protein YdjX (TVP38/TMEM64 family)